MRFRARLRKNRAIGSSISPCGLSWASLQIPNEFNLQLPRRAIRVKTFAEPAGWLFRGAAGPPGIPKIAGLRLPRRGSDDGIGHDSAIKNAACSFSLFITLLPGVSPKLFAQTFFATMPMAITFLSGIAAVRQRSGMVSDGYLRMHALRFPFRYSDMRTSTEQEQADAAE